ncbi:hypothetical protein J3458_020989 [Metarhizium acridum]|nr:hypothetical protein J3458_020989 [Metarhizium acridum]
MEPMPSSPPCAIAFGYCNTPVLLSFGSQLGWSVECVDGALYGSPTVKGYDNAALPAAAELYFVFNSTGPLNEAAPDYLNSLAIFSSQPL